MSDWQTAKKSCHGVCFGINPEDYGASQSDLDRLNRIGIVKYVQEGGRLPSDEHIQAIQSAVREFCEDSNKSTRNENSTFKGKPFITHSNEIRRQVVIFNPDGNDLISPNRMKDYLRTGNIGDQKNQSKQ